MYQIKTDIDKELKENKRGKEDFVVLSDQSGIIKYHVKYPEFWKYCKSRGGNPTSKGFSTWLARQVPKWVNQKEPVREQAGYELRGKFYDEFQAYELARQNPEVITKLRKAFGHHGKFKIL